MQAWAGHSSSSSIFPTQFEDEDENDSTIVHAYCRNNFAKPIALTLRLLASLRGCQS
jgi:hypothetical protein